MMNEIYKGLEIQKQDSRYWWFLCPFHDDHKPSMIVNKGGNYPDFFRCWACGEAGSPKKFANKMGFGYQAPKRLTKRKQRHAKIENVSPEKLAELYLQYLSYQNQAGYENLAGKLGLKSETLNKLPVGYTGKEFSFPMFDADASLIGFRLRNWNGKKYACKGSRNGLFLPPQDLSPKFPLFITEGESDCLAAYEMGFQVIGRPGSTQCKEIAGEFMSNWNFEEAIIIADNDIAGEKGSCELADHLTFKHGIKAKIIHPPKLYKDFRQWYNNGALREDIFDAIDQQDHFKPFKIKKVVNKITIQIGGAYAVA